MKSLRSRLVTIILAVLTLVLGIGGWAAHSLVGKKLFEQFDRGLSERAATLTAFVDKDEGEIEADWLTEGMAHPPGHRPGEEFIQIWNGAGEVVTASQELGGTPLPRPGGGSLEAPALKFINLPGGKRGRAASATFITAVDEDEIEENVAAGFDIQSESVTITVARIDTVTPMLASLSKLFVLVWLAASLAGGLLIWLNVRSTLRPLDSLRRQIGELRDGSRGGGVELENPPSELAPVTAELNRLIAKLEGAIVRERSLTSNVAHELRTPIAGLLSTLEVTLSRQREAAEYREASEDSFEIAKRMHWLVNNLLSMTRIEAGTVEVHNHIVELQPSLQEWWAAFQQRAGDKDIGVEWHIAPGARVETDPDFLRVVVTNLYDNAVSYTPRGGSITVSADAGGRIAIGNDAVDLSPGDAAKVFEPFWREDESRGDVGKHAGLGLSLCQKIVKLLGGNIRAAVPETGKRFEMTVELDGGVRT